MNSEQKYRKNMRCLDKWLSNREKDKEIADYLHTYRIGRIGIYGYGILGKHLVRELRSRDYPVSWVVDRAEPDDDACCNLLKPENLEGVEDVDMAIITTLADVEEVEGILRKHVTGRIISVEELIESIYVWGNQS